MLDGHKRNINYLRISVTDRCNMRCRYCMPADGVKWIDHDRILRFEEIIEVVKAAVSIGITKIRLTGGEPLVRRGIVDLVRMIANVPGVEDLAMTTNAQLLPDFANDLAAAGLKRVNVSLDTLDAEKYKSLSRGAELEGSLSGIEAAKLAGLTPIKINCVKTNQTTTTDKEELAHFCKENGYQLRFINEMSLGEGSFSPVEGGEGGRCNICNRIRLTASGEIKPCLFSNKGFNIREEGIESALLKAIGGKPASGHKNAVNAFYNIGG